MYLALTAYTQATELKIVDYVFCIMYGKTSIRCQISLDPHPQSKMKISQISAMAEFEGYFNTTYWAKVERSDIIFFAFQIW